MTEIQNSKQLAFDLICHLVLVICYFRDYPVEAFAFPILALTTAPQGPLFPSVVSGKA